MPEKKLKILLAASKPPPYGGVGNWVLLIEKFNHAESKIDLRIINTSPVSRGLDGRTVFDRVVRQGLVMLKQGAEIRRIFSRNRPDILHIASPGQLSIIRDILFLWLAKRYHVASVYHLHFGRLSNIAERNTVEWKLLRLALKLSNAVIAIDRNTFDSVRKYVPSVNVSVLPNPIEMQKLATFESLSPSHRKEVVFLGWMVKTKGIEELLTAWQQVSSHFPDWTLRMIGPIKPEYRTQIEALLTQNGVVYEGEKAHDDAMVLLSKAEIFILPSYTEGFPNAVLEAMTLQKAIIASNVGAIPEMLDNGCGTVIDPQKVTPIVQKLTELQNNPALRQELGQNARRKVEQEYRAEIVFEKYMRLWTSLTEKRRT